MSVPRGLLVFSLLVAIAGNVAAQPLFPHSKVHFETDLEAAYVDARAEHGGDMLVYFYRQGDESYRLLDSLVFSDERLSAYANENYANLAVDLDSPVGQRLFAIYNPGVEEAQPYIVVTSGRFLRTSGFHGWENEWPWPDEYGLNDAGQKWLLLVSMKEFGEAGIRPGDDNWGAWSARMRELVEGVVRTIRERG